jgi:protein O-mannosyl-transferase
MSKKKKSRVKVHKGPEPKQAAIAIPYKWLFLILGASFFVYLACLQNGFVWDDDKYIQNNPLITSIDLRALFSRYVMGNYHPLTMLVYALEYQLFGLDATGYHVVSLLLHLTNVLLVFYVVFLLVNKPAVAIIAALFFGIHPMHVESVAWASELKDLLYTAFFLGAYIFYLKYVNGQQNKRWYLYSLLLFLCSLLSKGMAVSFPVVLLLTDYFKDRKFTRQTIVEKMPFFALAVVFGIIAVFAQKSLGATESTVFPFLHRILFASYAFIAYIVKLILPLNLSSYYPYPVSVGSPIPPVYLVYPAILLLSIALLFYRRKAVSKKLFFGIGFFTITIFLVLQLLPVGDAVMADRYSYVPSIGLFYLAGEGLYWVWIRNRKMITSIIAAAFVVFFSVETYERCKVWENGLTLWNNVIDKYQTIAPAYYNRGIYLFNQNRTKEAFADFNKAIELKPNYGDAYNNRASVFIKEGKLDAALADLNNAILRDSNSAQGYFNRGYIYYQRQDYQKALEDYDRVIELKPAPDKLAMVYNLRGLSFMNENKNEQAFRDFSAALDLKPDFVEVMNNRGTILIAERKYNEAIGEFSAAIEKKADYAEAYFNRGIANFNTGKKAEACLDWQTAARLGNNAAAQMYRSNCP